MGFTRMKRETCARNIPSLLLKKRLMCHVIVVSSPARWGYYTQSTSIRQAPVSIRTSFIYFFFSSRDLDFCPNKPVCLGRGRPASSAPGLAHDGPWGLRVAVPEKPFRFTLKYLCLICLCSSAKDAFSQLSSLRKRKVILGDRCKQCAVLLPFSSL